ncbi:uncharacterized protein LOC126768575 isoform X2 [Nymphalis io]|uniref:uncharacterized protein LOC126768575 isoform X2 n=1 Tax=Inachis io TaxID=171585 RepID=UPI0021680B26|nr:uncharacterized protein LOC126768575 isoform X2 [Nymphalis io]
MDNFELEELSLTETNSSSSSSPEILEANQPFVLELHDIIRDEPRTETVKPVGKIKKKKKKRSPQDTDTIDTSSSSVLSDSLPRLTDTVERDKFYDADESYHQLTDGISTDATSVLPLAPATSKHSQDRTLLTKQSQTQRSTGSLRKSLSTLIKPSLPP